MLPNIIRTILTKTPKRSHSMQKQKEKKESLFSFKASRIPSRKKIKIKTDLSSKLFILNKVE